MKPLSSDSTDSLTPAQGEPAATPPRGIRSPSPEYTVEWGHALGSCLRQGDVLGLSAPLGIGKTQLVQGIARGFFGNDATLRVCSPSYTMINIYEHDGRRLHHIDLYRCSSSDDLESIGFWDALADPAACCVIEWLRQVPEALPQRFVELILELEDRSAPLDSARLVCMGQSCDPEMASRLAALFSAACP